MWLPQVDKDVGVFHKPCCFPLSDITWMSLPSSSHLREGIPGSFALSGLERFLVDRVDPVHLFLPMKCFPFITRDCEEARFLALPFSSYFVVPLVHDLHRDSNQRETRAPDFGGSQQVRRGHTLDHLQRGHDLHGGFGLVK